MKIIFLADLAEEGVSHNPAIKKQVLLARGVVPHLTNFSRARFSPRQVARAHKHVDMYEVFFVESGTGVIKVDGREQPSERGYASRSNLETHEVANAGTGDLC